MTDPDGAVPFRRTQDGIELFVRLTPRGGADRIDGLAIDASGQTRLALRVRAVPENGEANDALRRLLAGALGLPASAVRVAAGHAARLKTLAISGDAPEIAARLEALLPPSP